MGTFTSFAYDASEMVDQNDIPLSNGQYIAFFRPKPTWKGIGYGFDFVPDSFFLGETSLSMGKQYKKNNINELVTDPNAYDGRSVDTGGAMLNSLLANAYTSHRKNIKQMSNPVPYYCSWLSLYPQKGTKTISAFRYASRVNKPEDVRVERSEPENYTLNTKAELDVTVFGNGTPDYFAFDTNKHFKITPSQLEKVTPAQKKAKAQELKSKEKNATVVAKLLKWKTTVTIECLTDFEDDQELTLYACFAKNGKVEKVEAGKLMVWANKRRKTPKAIMIQVKTPPMSTTKKLDGVAPTNLSDCNAYLRQALVEMKLEGVIDLDLSGDDNFKPGGLYREGNKVKFEFPKTEQSTFGRLVDRITGAEPPARPTPLGEYLEKKIDKKYANYFKLFFFAEQSAHSGVAFNSAGNSKVTVYFNATTPSGVPGSTHAHELMHAMGLAHVFTNIETSPNALYTYHSLKTNNLMDYGVTGQQYSLCQWQWKIANNNAK